MRFKYAIAIAFTVVASSLAFAQSARRVAVLEMNGPLARANAIYAVVENRVADELTAKLTGQPGFIMVDRASIDKIIKEQNFQNSDRSSSDTAVKIGKLLGVSQIILVNLYDGNYTTHPETSGNTTRTMATQTLRANARMIDVESGVILAQPTGEFQETVQVSQVSKSSGFNFGNIRVPPKQTQSGGDPQAIQSDEGNKAVEAVSNQLASKLATAVGSAPGPKMESPLVAGIANGNVYINQGSNAGIKAADRFQIIRQVSVGLNDPTTGKPIVQKQRVCVLTIANVDESSSSGSCQGGLPQSKDVAEPMHP